MELIKSKGFVVFLVVLFSITLINSVGIKKYDERNKDIENSYISMVEKKHPLFS